MGAPSKYPPGQAPPLSAEDKAKIEQMYQEGASCSAIARAVGRHSSTVSNHCAKQGWKFPSPKREALVKAEQLSIKERTLAAHQRQLRILELEQARVLDHLEGRKPWPTKIRGDRGAEYIVPQEEILSEDWRNVNTALANSSQTLKHLAPLETPAEDAARAMADKLSEMLGLPTAEGDTGPAKTQAERDAERNTRKRDRKAEAARTAARREQERVTGERVNPRYHNPNPGGLGT